MPESHSQTPRRRPRPSLLSSAVARMLSDDPVFFLLQASRKLPAAIRHRLGNFGEKLPSSSASEFLQLLADRPIDITHSSRLSEEMRVLSGKAPAPSARPETQARYAWSIGSASQAVALLPPRSPLGMRYRDELRVLTTHPIELEPLRRAAATGRAARTPNSIDVLHVLVNSAPHTSSGYTVRTRAILEGQRDAGLAVAGVTRIGYPLTIGQLFPAEIDVVDDIPYYRLLPARLPGLPVARLQMHAEMLAELVGRLGPRILHATTNYENAVVADAVSEALGIPWVYEMRGQLEKTWVARQPEEIQRDVAASERYLLMEDKETHLAQRASGVVVLSEVQAADLVERGVDPSKIHVIANAYTPADVPARSPEEARKELGVPQAFTIGTITSIVDYEGLDTLVDAIGMLRTQEHNVRGVIVGDGVARPALESRIDSAGLTDHITLPGRVSREESHLWYQALDVFAVPRRDTLVCRTITPIKPVEAMSNGTPVVVSDLPPLRELVADDGAGLTSPAGDVEALAGNIERLITEPELYATVAAAGRHAASGRTWKANIERYLALYATLGISPK